jgi:CHAT domain-containing protein/Tfp pilus assembly protein PilF
MTCRSTRHSALDRRRHQVVYRNLAKALILFLLSSLSPVTSSTQALPLGPILQPAQEASSVKTEKEVLPLEPGRPIKRMLAGGQEHIYQITLSAGQFLKAVVEQDGIDARVKLSGPDGKQITEFDSERRRRGQETVSWVAEETGSYRVDVQAKYKDAVAGAYEIEVVELRLATEGDRALHEAQKLNYKFVGLYGAGKYDEALPLAERVLGIRERILGPEHFDVTRALNNLALLYLNKADYAKAELFCQRALAIGERTLGSGNPYVATYLNSLATIYLFAGDYAKAEPLFQRAIDIKEKSLGPEHPDVSNSLNNLAALYLQRSDYAKAEPLFGRTLAIMEKVLGPEHFDVAKPLINIADICYRRGDYARAEPLYGRALTILEKTLGAEHPLIATCLDRLAVLYNTRGDYSKAEPLYGRALAMRKKILRPEHPDIAHSFNNMAIHYNDKGDYVRAEPLYRRALTIFEKALGSEHPNVSHTLNNLGLLYIERGDYAKAEPLYRRALAITEKVLGPQHPDVTDLLNNLARLYGERGDYAKAEQLHRRALTIHEKALGSEHPTTAMFLANLARIYNERGDYAKAEPLYERALAIREKALGPVHTDVAASLNYLADLYVQRGDYIKAEPLYRRSLAIRERSLGPEHPYTAFCLVGLAELYAAKGDITRAIEFQSRANDVTERNLALNLATGSERQKLAYLALLSSRTDSTLWLHSQVAPNDPRALDLAFTTLVRRKARGLDAMTDTIATLRRHATTQDLKLLDQLTDARSQFATLRFKESNAANPDTSQTQLKSLEEQIDKLEGELSARSAEFRAQTQPVTLSAVQAALPADSALIEFMVYTPQEPRIGKNQPPRYLAYLLGAQGQPRWVDLGEAAPIDRAVDDWRKTLRGNRLDVKRLAREVDEKVMRPIRSLLQSLESGRGEIGHLLVAPDGSLNLIPFAALVDEENRYLLERYTISYLTTGRDLLRLQESRPSQGAPLVVADPQFGTVASARARRTQRSGNSLSGSQARNQQRRKGDPAQIFFRPLPGTKGEALAIKAVLPEASVLLQQEATEGALKRARAPRILHIATHGFFLSDQQASAGEMSGVDGDNPQRISGLRLSKWAAQVEEPLLRSGLALSGANGSENGNDDGVLTALEVAGLDLWGTKLVVLSACDTGVGEVRNGEGVQGLRRALVLAGSESQVMSLWPVTDEGAKEMMIEYYKALRRGERRSEGMRQVQLMMLRSEKRRHPFYWAAFIQSGEWANLEGRR